MQQSEIIVIGAGLTGLTTAFLLRRAGKNVKLIEKNDFVGGVMRSERENGFIYERGPNTGSLSNVSTIKLFDYLADECDLEVALGNSQKRLIWKNDKWTALPSGILGGLTTPLFSMKDKFRILGEPFRPKGQDPDETVADLVRRRLGESYLNYAVDPFISGIYAGDPNQLITRFALPKLYRLEQNYGSFIRGAVKKAREPKTDLEKRVTKSVFSVKNGFSYLVDALEKKVGTENIELGCNNLEVIESGDDYVVSFEQCEHKRSIRTSRVISTVGAYALRDIFPFFSTVDLSDIEALRYAGIALVVVGYKSWEGNKLDAFGGLMPSLENRHSLGILFPSAIFSNRCPEGGALLSLFFGGTKNEDFLALADERIKEVALEEISDTLGVSSQPDLFKIFRHKHAIAQYDVTTQKRLNAIERIENQHKNIFLCGNISGGVGIANRIEQAFNITERVLS